MAHEQAFEEQGEESLPPSHRQWQADERTETDLAQIVEMYEVMKTVNQRLSEHRTQPVRQTVGETTGLECERDPPHHTPRSCEQSLGTPSLLSLAIQPQSTLPRCSPRCVNLQEFDTRWIGPLFEALSWPNRRIRRIVRLKLLNLLPMLTNATATT